MDSGGDLFHFDVPLDFIDQVYAVMSLAPRHTFQILTKRAGNQRAYLLDPDTPRRVSHLVNQPDHWGDKAVGAFQINPPAWPLPNVWQGVSVENRATSGRIKVLRETPAAVRFISFEPLLERVEPDLTGIHCAIIGGESGKAELIRPFDIEWARYLVAQCRHQNVAPFVKQLGQLPMCANDDKGDWPGRSIPFPESYRPHHQGEMAPLALNHSHGGDMSEWPEDLRVREFPNVAPAASEARP